MMPGMPKMTKKRFEDFFREEVLPSVIERYEQDGIPDKPARRETWNDTVDAYIRDRALPEAAGNWSHPRWLETWSPPSARRHHATIKGSKKLTPQQAKAMLMADGMDFQQDFHALGSSAVQRLADVAKLAGYRKSKNAPGSTARMFYQYLSRVEPVVHAAGQLTQAERRAYQTRTRKKKTPSQLDSEIAAALKPR